jgi:hypothetical protein
MWRALEFDTPVTGMAVFASTARGSTIHSIRFSGVLVSRPVMYTRSLMRPRGGPFWWALLCGRSSERGCGAAVVYLFATSLHSGFLGIPIALARRPLYPLQTDSALE